MIKRIGDHQYLIDFHPHRHGPRVRRKVYGTRETAERVLLTLRERAIAAQMGWPERGTATVRDICALVVQDYLDHQRKSLRSARELAAFWGRQCGGKSADDVTGDLLLDWARAWMRDGISPARCNRRIAFLLRGYRLALKRTPPLVRSVPAWTRLRESAPRSGFLEWEDFARLRAWLPPHARIPATIGYWTGMRAGEVHGLRWEQVRLDYQARTVTIRLPDTKSGIPRTIVFGGDLYAVLSRWHAESAQYRCPYVCHRKGRWIKSIKSAWRTACVRAGLGVWTRPHARYVGERGYRGPIIHDLRRTAIRTLDRAGVPRRVAMAISGHETESTYLRYRIVSEADLLEAGARVTAYHERRTGGYSVDTPSPETEQSPRQHDGSCGRAGVS